MSADSVVGIGWDVLKRYVVVPIERGFGYVIYSKRFANRLRGEVQNLENEVLRVEVLAEQARNNVRKLHVVFATCKESADKALEEASKLLDDFEKATKTCCYGTLPDPKFRYQFSRKAEGKIEVIKQLTQKCNTFNGLDDISFIGPAFGNVATPNPARREGKDVQSTTASASASFVSTSMKLRDGGVFESRALMIQNIMDALADNGNSVVGIYGMGGVGKSTLLEDTEKIIREEKSFDLVAQADVSEHQDIKRIQGEIAHKLCLSDLKNEECVRVRAELLHGRLKVEERNKKTVLIILDNLWKGLDLKSVGIPCGPDDKVVGCKLLLTSRDRDVLRRDMGCDKDFHLGGLKEEEAKTLFERIVGDKVHDDEFKPWVEVALDKCAGVPFLIIAMAKRFKDADLYEWRDTFKKIEKFKDTKINDLINQMLKWSYDRLEEDEKSLLQLCVVYAISTPSLENLVRYGVGLGLFKEVSGMKDARERLSSQIRTLQASSLLLDSEDVDGFKIHDLVREFIASVASKDHFLLVLKDKDKSITELLKDKLKSCRAVCFPHIDMKAFPKELDCSELRIFLLFTNNESFEVPDSYFNSMEKLMVLTLTSTRLVHSPKPFHFLENLRTLCLEYCSLEDVAILGKLKGLQILSIVDPKIKLLPKEIGQLVELRLLDLSRCSQLEVIEPGVLGSLTKLEELYMRDSFNQWNVVDQTPPTNASLIELNNMKNLCTLQVSIPNSSMLPGDLNVKKFSKYIINIGDVQRWTSKKGSGTLNLQLDPSSDVLRKGCIQSILGKSDDLFLDGLSKIEQSICALSHKDFLELKHLQVTNSPSVHYILQSPSHTKFKMLESLFLENLINLEKISNNNITSKSFSALKVLRVENCNNMEILFPLSVARELSKLKEIEVVGCKLMRGIIEADDCGKVELHNLHALKFRDLPNIKNFFTVGMAPSSSTSNDQVGTQIAFFNGQQVAFQSLGTLKISGLDNLEILFFPSMVKSLMHLKKLTVSNCEKIEAIIMEEDGLGVEISEIVAFPMLTHLYLEHLKSLMRFSCGKCARESRSQDRVKSHAIALFNQEVVFPRLETLYITSLDNIVMIWDDQVAKDSFPKLKSLCVDKCNRLVNIVTSSILGWILSLESLKAQSCGLLKVVFKFQPLNPLDGHLVAHSLLKELELFDLPELKCVWDKELHRQVKFQCLHSISVYECESLTSIFPESIARDLTQFEELKIKKCGIVELIEKEGSEELNINVEAIEGASHELKLILPSTSYFQHLKTLDVSYCDRLSNMFAPTMATNLVALTKLRIRKCRMFTEVISDEGGWEGYEVVFNQLKYMELKGLTRLRCFSSSGDTLMLPLLEDVIVTGCLNMNFFSKGPIEAPKLKRVRVSRDAATTWFWKGNLNITIQNMFEEMGTFAGVKKMLLSELPNLVEKWHSELNPIKSSWQLESLTVDKCPSFINAIPSMLMLGLDNMETLQVRDCELLEEIFDLEGLEGVESSRMLPSFATLDLVNLPKLRRLWNKDLQGSLPYNFLNYITLYNCNILRYAFAPLMARCLANLQWMEIKECGQMEGVIAEEEGQGSAGEKITFPKLEQLKLECLPNLTSFLLGKNHTLECPKLQKLIIAHCPKMKSLTWRSLMEIGNGTSSLFTPQVQFPQLASMGLSHMDNLSKIWTDNPLETLKFKQLWKLEAQNCKSLENLFPHWVATRLTQLKNLRVESCVIKEIVASGDDTPHSNNAQVLFPKLTSLVLHDMPQLKCFSPNLPNLNWPSLEELRVTHCNKVNKLSFVASMNKWTKRNDQQELSRQEAHSSLEMDFPMLERLSLVKKNIQMIQDGRFPDDIFGKPIALTLACFHDEKAVFPPRFLLEKFQNLQSLEVFCSSFEDIFPNEGLVDKGKHPVLENLRELKLNKLHNLKRVWREDSLVSKILQSIKTFEVWDCPCLTTIFPAMTSFQNLMTLVVKNSSGLVHLVTTSAITNLVNLTWMTIIGCERMKEVVTNDGNEEGKVISFEKLERLRIQRLPSLECFSSATNCSFRFPSLRSIEVEECPKIKKFSKGKLSTPKLCSVTLFRYKWEGNRGKGNDLNTIIQKLSA